MTPKEIVKTLIYYLSDDNAEINEHEASGRIMIDVKVSNAKDLIGEKGSTLFMLEHIARRMVSKNISPECIIDLDINNYKKMRENVMREFALEVADRVRMQRKAMELEPMPSMDRRVIHLTLSDFQDLTTESFGEESERYIVVRPTFI